MNKQLAMALVVCISFSLLTIMITDGERKAYYSANYVIFPDNGFHWQNIVGKWSTWYPPLWYWLSQPFKSWQGMYFYFSVFFIGIIFPMVLFVIAKRWEIVLFYFTATNFFWFNEFVGTFPSALALLILLVFAIRKEWFIRIGLVIAAILSHSHGLLLILTFLLIESFFGAALAQGKMVDSLWVSDRLCPEIPHTIKDTGIIEQLKTIKIAELNFRLIDLLTFIGKMMLLPILILAVSELYKTQQYTWLGFATVLFLLGITNTEFYGVRFWEMTSIPLLFGFTSYYANAKKETKIILLGLCVLAFIINFTFWLERLTFHYCISGSPNMM